MDTIRLVIALTLFLLGAYLVVDLFFSGFDYVVLVAALICFVSAHYVKPKRYDDESVSLIVDLLDFVIDIPFRIITGSLRLLGRLFKDNDADGIDL